MSLVVPRAPTVVGRTAAARVEAPQLGGALAEAGNQMFAFGTALEDDRLDRQMARLKVDMTRDLGELRLQVEDMGDPDAAGAAWDKGVAGIREQYQTGIDDAGRPRIDPKNAENFGLVFDDLTNSHALALGKGFLDLRQSQRRATLFEYSKVAMNSAAAASDAGTRDRIRDDYREALDRSVAAGALSAEDAAKALHDYDTGLDSARAIEMMGKDPEAVIAALDRGEFGSLDPEAQARTRVLAEAEITRRTSAQKVADDAAAKVLKADVDDAVKILDSGRPYAGLPELMDRTRGTPEHARLIGAVDARDASVNFALMTSRQQADYLAALRGTASGDPADVGRYNRLMEVHKDSDTAWGRDPLTHARGLGLIAGAPLDLSDAASVRQRKAEAEAIAETYTPGLPVKYFDAEEAAALTATLSGNDPDQALAVVATLQSAFGADAGAALDQIGQTDQVARLAGHLALETGDPAAARYILAGRQALKDGKGNKIDPTLRRAVIAEYTPALMWAMGEDGTVRVDPGRVALAEQAADAYFAAAAPGVDPKSDEGQAEYERAWNAVQGGNVQIVHGELTVLPADLDPERVERAISRFTSENWKMASATGNLPLWGGRAASPPVTNYNADLRATLFPVSIGDGLYLLAVRQESGRIGFMADPGRPDGRFVFDLRKFVTESSSP